MSATTHAAVSVLACGSWLAACGPTGVGSHEVAPEEVALEAGSAVPLDAGFLDPEFGGPPPLVSSGGILGGLGPLTLGSPLQLGPLRTADEPPPPISGGSLAVAADSRYVVAADPDRDVVYLVEPAALKVRKVELAAGSEPGRVVFDDAGAAHVALRGRNRLARIDLATATLTSETELCEHPRGVGFAAAKGTVVVGCLDGQLVSLDAATHEERERFRLPYDLRDVLIDPSGKLSATRYRSAELLSVSVDGRVGGTTHPPSTDAAEVTTNAFPPGLIDSLLDAGLDGIFVDGGLPLPSGFPSAQTDGTLSPALAWRSVLGSAGEIWMLHQQAFDGELATGPGAYGSDCQAAVSGAITAFGSDGLPARHMSIPLQGLSVDLALSPDEAWLAVASPGGFMRRLPTLELFSAGDMRAVPTASCTRAVSGAAHESQTVAVAFGADGLLYAFSREPAELSAYHLENLPQAAPDAGAVTPSSPPTLVRTFTVALDLSSVRDTGHDLFHADAGRGMACAACHGEALDDGHLWSFQGLGPRRTQNLRGGLLATAPFFWDGDMPSMENLINEVFTRRMGGPTLDPSYAAALASWVDQQPPLSIHGEDAAAVARGQIVFESRDTGCTTCHSGALFTDHKSVDVGTGGSFQVPGLLGLSLRGPYMHDGCAATLEARFEPTCGGTMHGNTTQLSEAQIEDLVAYLRSL